MTVYVLIIMYFQSTGAIAIDKIATYSSKENCDLGRVAFLTPTDAFPNRRAFCIPLESKTDVVK